jgi:NADH-quinone oxidoreductase subunit L
LARALPVVFWTFLIGAASLSALPFVTAGFYSKELILAHVGARPFGAQWLLVAGLIGSLITAAYTFRVVFLVFFGEQKMEITKRPGALMTLSLVVLAFFSITGFVGWRQLDFGRAS